VPPLGIDLGTTNCGFAFAAEGEAPVEIFPVPQLIAPGQVHPEPLLESSLYLARDGEFGPGALDLPWRAGQDFIAGRFAARRGAETAGRLVSSAKSWLCHTGAPRLDPILPPNAPEGAPRVSPVEASRRYLQHLAEAWDHAHPEEPFDDQPLVLTVPASFDAVARQLTQQAAEQAGYPPLLLLEEPQAAFYAWIAAHPDWRDQVQAGDLILVIDVGGGTTDFTLIAVRDEKGDLALERVAVGEHLLLGGDNMDLALAHAVAARLPKLDPLQFQSLWQQCRLAKEHLLMWGKLQPASGADSSPVGQASACQDILQPAGGTGFSLSSPSGRAEAPIAILGRGSSLIGGTIKAKLTRAEVEALLVDGFFPAVASTEMPAARPAAGFVELGLPYASDPAITRHLARFLRHDGALARPTHLLFNGGVFLAEPLRNRVVEVLNSWLAAEGAPPVQLLPAAGLMHAVARGAAYYARARRHGGLRIRGGINRAYYVGIETAMPAVPGFRAPLKALCVAPFGMEEGSDLRVPSAAFGLQVGAPAEFRFFASAARTHDTPGLLLEDIPPELEELAPMQVTLPAGSGETGLVRVNLETAVTETGVLELWCGAPNGNRWKLEFQVREKRR
jgi:hypothetical protein